VTASPAAWLAAIDELGWRRVGPGARNINWSEVLALIAAVRVGGSVGQLEERELT
jgi:hypothetical protein